MARYLKSYYHNTIFKPKQKEFEMKNTLLKTAILLFVGILTLGISSCTSDPISVFDDLAASERFGGNSTTCLDSIEISDLSEEETAELLFMREEEKLARDVYTVLYAKWKQGVFNNISKAEQQHMDALLNLIERYDLEDPVENNEVGAFTNTDLATLYTTLTQQGELSLVDALKVGAAIEEIDILDLYEAIEATDNEDLKIVYNNLLKGSENHLNSFVRVLGRNGVTYSPQYLTQAQYDEIMN